MNLDTIGLTVTAPGAGGAAMAAVAGDSLQMRNARAGSNLLCISLSLHTQVAGVTNFTWPSGHDMVRGYRVRDYITQPDNKLSYGFPMRFRPQDPLTVSRVGSAVAGDVENAVMLMFYEDLPGVAGRLMNIAALRQRGVQVVTVDDSIASTAGGAWNGARALNAGSDLLKANTDYAVLGAVGNTTTGFLSMRGVDNGNLRISVPIYPATPTASANFFVDLAVQHQLPVIPVFNSANKAGIFQEVLVNENLGTMNYSWILVELSPQGAKA